MSLISLINGGSWSSSTSTGLLGFMISDFFFAFCLFNSSVCFLISEAEFWLFHQLMSSLSMTFQALFCIASTWFRTPVISVKSSLLYDTVVDWYNHPPLSNVHKEISRIPCLIKQQNIYFLYKAVWYWFLMHSKSKWLSLKYYIYIFFNSLWTCKYLYTVLLTIIKSSVINFIKKPFLPDNCRTYNMNDNPKNNILMLENIRQSDFVWYFPTLRCYFSDYCSY